VYAVIIYRQNVKSPGQGVDCINGMYRTQPYVDNYLKG
jgi:hypothetical protein